MDNATQTLLTPPLRSTNKGFRRPGLRDAILLVLMALLSFSPDTTNGQTIRVAKYNQRFDSGGDWQFYSKIDYAFGLGWTNIVQTNLHGEFSTNGPYILNIEGLIKLQGTNSTGWDTDSMLLSTNWTESGVQIWNTTNTPPTAYSTNFYAEPGLPAFPGEFPYPFQTATNDFAKVSLELLTGGSTNSRYPSLYKIYFGAKQNGEMITNTEISLITSIGTNNFTNVCNTDYHVFETWSDCTTNLLNPTFGAAYTNVKFAATVEKVNVKFAARSGMMNQGYDPRPGTSDDHWTSLAVGGTNEITELQILRDWATNQVELIVTGPITLSQTAGFTETTTPLIITSTGTDATNATIEVQYKTNHATLAKLQVLILPKRQIPVGIYRIYDSCSGVDTSLSTTESNAAIIERLNSVFKQACLEFADATVPLPTDPYDNRYDVDIEDGRFNYGSDNETEPIRSHFPMRQGQIRIIIANKGTSRYFAQTPEPISWARAAHANQDVYGPTNEFLVVHAETAQGIQSTAAAHEVGHYLGIEVHDDRVDNGILFPKPVPPGESHLMIDGASWFQLDTDPPIPANFDYATANWRVRYPGVWLRKQDWEMVNGTARTKPGQY